MNFETVKEIARMASAGLPRDSAKTKGLADFRRLAERRLPRMIFDFVDGGAEGEVTLRANQSDFSRITFRPRSLIDVSNRNLSTSVMGERLALPILLAPTGLARLVHPDGELAAARAAQSSGSVFVLSTASSWSLEDVAAVSAGPLWFQLYMGKNREVIASMIQRARTAGYQALVVTVDVPVTGKRERDLRNGMTILPRITPRNALDVALHPRYLRGLLTGPPITFSNLAGSAPRDIFSRSRYFDQQIVNPGNSWEDFKWLRELWEGPLIVKGIMTTEDALNALDCGANGIIVSNHGGRQLDSLPSTIEVLEDIVKVVGDRGEVILDGGVRRGSDVVKCIALGARAVMIGRPWLWGLAVDGEMGIQRVLEILASEIDRTLALLGRPALEDIDRSVVDFRSTMF